MTTKIACIPLTGRIFSGRVNESKQCFVGKKTDVTNEVLEALIRKAEYHKGGFIVQTCSKKWTVTVVEESI